MSRRPVHRRLPGLADLHPAFRGFPADHSDLHGLTATLRETVAQLRQDHPQPFYAQRELARFFGVPLRTVHLACQQLAAEGLLFCLQGAVTMMTGRKLTPRVPARGVVGLPILTQAFVDLQWWRSFFICLEEELRKRNFVADLVFYRVTETFAPELADRLVAHHLDYLVWLLPLPRTLPVLERLVDGGVRVMAVIDRPRLPHTIFQYVTVWENAYYRALRAWRQAGIAAAVVVGERAFLEAPRHPVLRALDRLALPYEIQSVRDLAELPRHGRRGVVFPDDFAQAQLSRGNPQAMIRLLQESRVLLANALQIRDVPPEVRMDVVRVEWEKLARRIADDLTGLEHQPVRPPVVVHARAFSRVPARQFAEEM